LTFVLLLAGCKKEFTNNSILVNSIKTKDGFPNQSFNWETQTLMMQGVAAGPLNPSLPWSSQSGSYVNANIITDYKSNDGWVLVYNTFNPSYYTANAASGGLYFALYNKYRGLLRYYLYVPAGQFGGGVNIQHGLSIYLGTGLTTTMLNFDGTDIVDPSATNLSFTKTNNVGIAQQGGWYDMQYEIAYDHTFSSAVFPNLGIAWNSRTITISDIKINGTEAGTETGSITQQGNNGLGSVIINGVAAAAEIWGISDAGIAGSRLQSAASGGLAGNLTGFFSGIFGGNSNNTQEVDLKMNSTIALTGTITTPNSLAPNTFVFPGESIASGNGSFPPLYTSLLGVFNLNDRPIVNVHTTTSSVLVNDGGVLIPETQYLNVYTVNTSNFNSLFTVNPAVITSASISNLKTQVVLLNPSTIYGFQPNGNRETIGNYIAYTSYSALSTTYTKEHGPQPVNSLAAVRVSFDVVPTNGAPKSTIVKTFFANIVNI